ncbi:heat resistance system K+/H+ antiporter KefB-GI [Salmonella enterica subsp. enterica serovar Senftenberg]|nr:sodium:proton exchanger [Salmonella enterica subsp. enterica serovar Senftenberg]EHY4810981.1 heat resistance system K+/H+ antiporter KefB-GI [Salmonella enterica subsp. enterica serovar Rough:g,s,t:-]HAK6959713.1 heat resistance system K+/H+ antiporter KefB-GI [Salmonella enterica]EBL5855637.1 heat resistance system K+/H+ antiporter KefB-GI [Salmonella enterica subsp. enterica serovar Senftenberg]EBN0016998.1 heat resistance system K+/H+ antiporter KefB-GI [Salmonella enterica subsp. enteri
MQGLLGTTLILLAACSLAAMATAAFRVPALLGYLSVGVVLGPSVIGVIAPGETLSFLSELGVALLLFMVGLEFSLGDFWLARRTVLMAGALQMIAVAPPLILLLMWLGQPGQSAALLGTAAAMSSTALVSRQLADQGELTTRHGRSAIAVLVFQDLASVPLLALLAIWARGESPKIEHVLLEVFGVLLLFAAAALASRRLLHGLLGWVARRGHEESFVLVSLCVVVAAAAAAHAVGVSAALGAFLAGMVLGESDFRHHMESHLRPFRDVLSGVFFVTIGLQLDAAQILSAPLAVLAWLVVLVPVKILLNTLALRATRLSALDAWRTGIALGHGGEFALLLLGTVLQQHLIPATVVQPMLVALVLSMALAPLLIRHHDVLARFLSRTGGVIQPPQAEEVEIAAQTTQYRDHVIICGAGELGLTVSEILRHAGVAHLLLEADAQKVEAARAAGAPVFHADASRPDTLLAAGLTHAHLVVLTFAHAQQALRIAQAIAEHRPALTLWVSCRSTTAADAFRAMPNVRVYQQSFAAAIGLTEQVMSTLGMSTELIEGHISAMRRRLDSNRFPGSSSS